MNPRDQFTEAIASGQAKEIRLKAQLSQKDVADKLGISPSAVARWEGGNRIPDDDVIVEYLALLASLGWAAPSEVRHEVVELADGDTECPPNHHKLPNGECAPDDTDEGETDMAGVSKFGIAGVATLEGSWTGDGRQFASGSLSWPDPAETDIPFQWQKETSHGGDNDLTVNIGRLTSIERSGDQITYAGFIDTGSEDGAEYVRRRQVHESRGGVSIVADDPEQSDIEISFGDDGEPEGVIFHSGRIRALTAVDVPAFAEAYVELTEPVETVLQVEAAESFAVDIGLDDGLSFVSEAAWNGAASRFSDEQYKMSSAACDPARGDTVKAQCFLPHHEPGGVVSRAGVHAAASRFGSTQASGEAKARAAAHLRGHYSRDLKEDAPDSIAASAADLDYLHGRTDVVMTTETDPELAQLDTMIAAAHAIQIEDRPPKEWFAEPADLPDVGAITVTDEGRFYGLLAPSGVAHRAFAGKRVTVPTGNVDYANWMSRQTITAEGERVATGAITMECGHAPTSYGTDGPAAMDHYDNACSVVATARVGENRHGVWIAGALLPDVTPGQVARMMACQLSGDWRPHREKSGKRELAGALLVPVPGFPVATSTPSLRMDAGELVASAAPVHWLAAGSIPDPEDDDEGDGSGEIIEDTDDGTAASADDLPSWEDVRERQAMRAKIDELAASFLEEE